MLVLPIVLRGRPLLDVLEQVSILLIVLIPAIGQQYFLLPPLDGTTPRPGYWLYTTAVILFLFAGPDGLHLAWLARGWWPTWLAAVIWFIERSTSCRMHGGQPSAM